jgi:hypothetical protein
MARTSSVREMVTALLLMAVLPCLCSGLAVTAGSGTLAAIDPEIVVPGQWLTNTADDYLFLTLSIPQEFRPEQCKVLTNGGTLLVVVTEAPKEEPEDAALKKYKLIMEALKSEVGHDERLLGQKLQTWMDTEDDEEVKVRVRSALDSLNHVKAAKRNSTPRTISVPLGVLDKGISKVAKVHTALSLLSAAPQEHALPALARRSANAAAGMKEEVSRVGIIRESFAVEIPYPAAIESMFMIEAQPGLLIVGMPLNRKSLEAQGLSTGEKPYERVPLFGVQGQRLAGPRASLNTLTKGLNVAAVAARTGLIPLS